MPIKSLFSDFEVPKTDLWSFYLSKPWQYSSDHTLLVDGETERSYTHAEIAALSARFGQGLVHRYQWRKGDVLGFYTPNNIDTPVANFGVLWAGGISSPANPAYTVEELARQLKDAGARALITQVEYLESARRAARQAGIAEDMVWVLGDGRREGVTHWTDISADGAWWKPSKPRVADTDLAYLVYSSGTTGMPKGVMLTHRNVVANALQSARFDLKSLNHDSDSQLAMLPFYHIYGLSVVLNATWQSGAPAIVMPKWEIEKGCRIIEKFRITFIYCPPPVILALSKDPVVDNYDLCSVKWINSGAAPLSQSLVERTFARLRIPVKQGYGLSETSPTTHTQFSQEFWMFQGSIGKMCANMQAKIVDEAGQEVPEGESGELLLKGPNVFSGYWNRPDLQKDTFDADGWFKSGDVVRVDKHGNFYITDRIKELIKYKGFQVAPAELEHHLVGRSDVADACVIGVWDREKETEVPRAYVQVSPGVEESAELAREIEEWVAGEVAPQKRLRGGVRFLKEVPKSPSGKIMRRFLRDQVRKEEEEGEKPKAKL